MRALMNYCAIRARICPGDQEPLTLLVAVHNVYYDRVHIPSGKDIAALFCKWQAKRASTANKGISIISPLISPPNNFHFEEEIISYKWVKDTLEDITKVRHVKAANIAQDLQKAKVDSSATKDSTTESVTPRGGGGGARGGFGGFGGFGDGLRGGRGMGRGFKNNRGFKRGGAAGGGYQGGSDGFGAKKPRAGYCHNWNNGDCGRDVSNDACRLNNLTLNHACNFKLPSNLYCNGPHKKVDHPG